MFDNLSVRNKFLAVAAVPANVLVVVAVWAASVLSEPLLAAVAGLAAVVTIVVAHLFGSSVGDRIAVITAKMTDFDMDAGIEGPNDDGSDEVGDLDRALTSLTRSTKVETDERRSRANERLGAMMRDFSDRNHSLIDGQLDHIDWLEATEEDPDRLEHLFELDHLANRMRRNGESIMVLAGVDAGYQRTSPAPVTDVLRVAMGYNTRYRDLGLLTVDEVLIVADAAWETTHLLSELLENATQFSPTDARAEIYATLLDDGSYRITIIDHGYGMSDKQLATASSILSNPPDLDLTDANSIGLQVAGRLASKLNATVDLSPTAGSGTTVEILLPAAIIAGPVELAPKGEAEIDRRSTEGLTAPAPRTGGKLEEWVPPTVEASDAPLVARTEPVGARNDEHVDVPAVAHQPKTLDEALGTVTDFDADVENLLVSDESAEQTPLAEVAVNEIPEALRGPVDDDSIAALRPADDDPVEDPGEGAGEATASDGARSGEDWTPPEVAGRAAAEELGLKRRKRPASTGNTGAGSARPARASSRKPEEVRSMISQYRDGLKGGKKPAQTEKASDGQVGAEPKA